MNVYLSKQFMYRLGIVPEVAQAGQEVDDLVLKLNRRTLYNGAKLVCVHGAALADCGLNIEEKEITGAVTPS